MLEKQSNQKIKGLLLLGLALLWITAGCATMDKFVQHINQNLPSRTKKSDSKPAYYCHKVRYSGESLSLIAEWYTGDVENWHYLARVNSKLDPNRIKIGTKIRIPENLLRTRKRLPKTFVAAAAKRHQPTAAAAPKRPSRTYHYHKVKYSGETLSLVAKWYTGDGENWRYLAKENPKLDPNRIVVGNKIRIPKRLLNTKKPMPRSFVVWNTKSTKPKPCPTRVKSTQTVKKEPEPSQPSPPEKESAVFELFGPK
jgi:uncharacterized short protein YbdD (DUF466 family)